MDGDSTGEAAHLLALEAAEGHGMSRDFTLALDHLRASAELGFALAQASLAALSGDWALTTSIIEGEPSTADWQSLRNRIDIAAWTATPAPKVLSAAPRVALIEGLATAEMCDWLIARARPGLAPAQVYDPKSGGPMHQGVRTNRECFFPLEHRDLVFSILRARIARATGLPVGAMEAPTILHYAPGQHFLAHHDYLNPAAEGHAKNIAAHGQRVLTLLLCLNDDYEGGETEFPLLAKRFKGRKGNALFFWNVDPDGKLDKSTLHAGLAPSQGEKWMFSQWIRERE